MRTTVYTDANDMDETDEWPSCHGSVQDGELVIANEDGEDEETYRPGEWVSFETFA